MSCYRFNGSDGTFGVVTIGDEVEAPMRGRKRAWKKGSAAEVIAQVSTFRGFSVFWATETMKRALAITRAERQGRILHEPGGIFPWCYYRLPGQKPRMSQTTTPAAELPPLDVSRIKRARRRRGSAAGGRR